MGQLTMRHSLPWKTSRDREIQERMKRLNTRHNQKARPPRQPPSREGGLERQSSLDSEASLASSQSFASNITQQVMSKCHWQKCNWM